MDLVALRHVESSRTRAPTCVSCIGRQIPMHWATGEVLFKQFLVGYLLSKLCKVKKNHQIKHSKFKRCNFSNGKPVVREIISLCAWHLQNKSWLPKSWIFGKWNGHWKEGMMDVKERRKAKRERRKEKEKHRGGEGEKGGELIIFLLEWCRNTWINLEITRIYQFWCFR